MSQNSEQNSRSAYGFTAAHFGLVAGCLALLLGFSVATGDLTLQKLSRLNPLRAFSANEPATGILTYEQLRAQIDQELNQQYGSTDNRVLEKQNEQLALIDPTINEGIVLGATLDELPSADDLLTQENLNKISVNVSSVSDKGSIESYITQLEFFENYYEILSILTVVSTHDSSLAADAQTKASGLISELSAMTVPSPLVEYHKTKILYYSALLTLTKDITEQSSSEESTTAGILFFALTDKLQQQANDIKIRYGLEL